MRTPRNNSQERRRRKMVAKLRRRTRLSAKRQAVIAAGVPVYLDLIWYVSTRWGITTKQVWEALRDERLNVNGQVHQLPQVRKRDLEYDQRGLPRIMVEGHPDPRSPVATTLNRKGR